MEFLDASIWEGKIFNGAWLAALLPPSSSSRSGNGFRFGSLSNGDEFTESRWITAGGQQLSYPF